MPNRLLTHDGITLSISDWADRLDTSQTVISARLARGWPIERVLSHVNGNPRLLTHDGMTMSMSSWARQLGVTPSTISVRIKRGWPIERVLSQNPDRHAIDDLQPPGEWGTVRRMLAATKDHCTTRNRWQLLSSHLGVSRKAMAEMLSGDIRMSQEQVERIVWWMRQGSLPRDPLIDSRQMVIRLDRECRNKLDEWRSERSLTRSQAIAEMIKQHKD